MDEIEKHEKQVERVVVNFGKRSFEPVAHALAVLAGAVLYVLRWVASRAASASVPALPGRDAEAVNAKIEAATYMAETRSSAAQKTLRHYLGLGRERPFEDDCNAEIDSIVQDIVTAAVASAEARFLWLGRGAPPAPVLPATVEDEDARQREARACDPKVPEDAIWEGTHHGANAYVSANGVPHIWQPSADGGAWVSGLGSNIEARLLHEALMSVVWAPRAPVASGDPTADAPTLRRAVELARRAITMAQGELGDVETLTRAETALRVGAARVRLQEAEAALAAAPEVLVLEWTFSLTGLDSETAGLQLQGVGAGAWEAVCTTRGAIFKAWEEGQTTRQLPRVMVRLVDVPDAGDPS